MNIFAISDDPKQAARWLVDIHSRKMCLESAQILCSVFHLQGIEAPYKLSHKNHPSNIWSRTSRANFNWLLDHTDALFVEYTERYGKIHKSQAVAEWARANSNFLKFEIDELTPFAQAMPEEFRGPCAVEAYRRYYREGKKHLHQWKQNRPPWI